MTFGETARVAWLLLWRGAVLVYGVESLLVFFLDLENWEPDGSDIFDIVVIIVAEFALLFLLGFLSVTPPVVYMMMRKRFQGFHLAIVSAGAEDGVRRIGYGDALQVAWRIWWPVGLARLATAAIAGVTVGFVSIILLSSMPDDLIPPMVEITTALEGKSYGMTRAEIENLFTQQESSKVNRTLLSLEDPGLAHRVREKDPDSGKPTERWFSGPAVASVPWLLLDVFPVVGQLVLLFFVLMLVAGRLVRKRFSGFHLEVVRFGS